MRSDPRSTLLGILLTGIGTAYWSAPVAAQLSWSSFRPDLRPSERTAHAIAGGLMFGGRDVATGKDLADTWGVGAGAWYRSAVNGPPARRGHALAHVSRWLVMPSDWCVLFGGQIGDQPAHTFLGDTWIFGPYPAGWQQHKGPGPSPRRGHAMVFAPNQNEQVVLFGGETASGVAGDTWGFDTEFHGWGQAKLALSPPARTWHGMAYDLRRDRVVLFGGKDASGAALGDTWEWDGTTWMLVATKGPQPRARAPMAYDAVRARVVMKDGVDTRNREIWEAGTWEWDGKLWIERLPSSPALPRPRTGAERGMDTSPEGVVMFGGRSTNFPNEPFDHIWYWGTAFPATSEMYGGAGSCLAGVLRARPFQRTAPWLGNSRPWLDGDFEIEFLINGGLDSNNAFLLTGVSDVAWGSLKLPLDLGFLGHPGCLLRTSVELVSPPAVSDIAYARWQLRIPTAPSLIGAALHHQAIVFSPKAQGGFGMSDAMRARIGAR